MAISDKLNVLVKNYVRRPTPTINQEQLGPYIQDQLRDRGGNKDTNRRSNYCDGPRAGN